MADLKPPPTGFLFFGLLFSEGIIPEEIHARLCAEFGDALAVSGFFPWDLSTHYEKEMGAVLRRQFLAIDGDYDISLLGATKRRAMEIEEELAHEGDRRVNIDPGYIALEHVALASTKRQAHRMHIGEGVYGEVTLLYHRQTGYDPLLWTYPDYKSEGVRAWFNGLRRTLKSRKR